MWKTFILACVLFQIVIYPSYKGIQGEIDYGRPAIVIDRNEIYQTYPGTTERDYTKDSWTIEREPTISEPTRLRSRHIIDMEDPLK